MNNLAVRKDILSLERAIIDSGQTIELETNHYYADGTYTRELFLPAGTVLTGKIHKQSCINIISKGKILVVSEQGEYEIEAPHTFVSGAGIKKAGYVLEDTVWINVHPWSGEDLEELERKLIAPSYDALEG